MSRPRCGPGTAERRPVRQHQPPDRRADPRQGTAGRASTRCSSIRWPRPTGRRSPSCSRNCWRSGHAGAEYDAWPIRISDGDQFGSGFVEMNPNSKIPALLDRSGPEADPGVRIRRDPAPPGREVRRVPAAGRRGARRNPVLAVLADGHRAVPGRRFRPFLRLCAGQVRICRSTATRWRPNGNSTCSTAASRKAIRRRRRLYHRRHRRSGPGTAAWRSAGTTPARTNSCAAGL